MHTDMQIPRSIDLIDGNQVFNQEQEFVNESSSIFHSLIMQLNVVRIATVFFVK